MDDLDVAGENSPSTSTGQQNGHSGITLVLPSLRALKAANAGKKSKPKQASAELEQRLRIPRPIKLKPLKEVLTKLITQIKKKDDYAFFIQPVDPVQVPGYTDMIKNPMDLGTMTVKVAKGKYRSLEEFTTDFRLVTTNTKTFNPPGSIYYTEADRLETWGLDHIARVSAHVIEYETDWNIDIEQDDDGSTSQLPVNIDDEVSTPRDVDGSLAAGSRAPSMTPAPGQAPTGKRGPRGPYKKHAQTALQEGLDAEGRMPGAKDGVGTFPAGSDWAELMIALKIKGKRYKTKKERLRFEREGPPYHADGSLDYAEMEEPFSILNVFVPEPPSRPQVTPLYPPSFTATPALATTTDGTQSQPHTSQPRIHAPIPVTTPSNRPIPILSTVTNVLVQSTSIASTTTPSTRPPKKRRHWTIVRNAPARSRAKDKEADATVDEAKTSWKIPRDAGPTDYGTFAAFFGELVASAVGTDTSAAGMGAAEYIYGSEPRLFATIRSTVEHRGVKRKREAEADHEEVKENAETFWTDERAEEAWDYLRDVVYGGADGYAYVRSLAEFVAPSVYLNDARKDMDADKDNDNDDHQDTSGGADQKVAKTPEEHDDEALPLGVSLARYVEDNLIDMVTRGRHGWLRDVFLPAAVVAVNPVCTSFRGDGSTSPFLLRMSALPGAARAMASFRTWSEEPLDMAVLIRKPEELAKEGVLEGGPGEGGEHADIERALQWGVGVMEELGKQIKKDGLEDHDGGREDVGVKVELKVKEEEEEEDVAEDARVAEEEEEEEEAHEMDVDHNVDPTQPKPEPELDTDTEEDALVKRLRMNLLALAKRAPLDRIARLPIELVPESIRAIVPTA
ncbi:hypothetical protein EV363DRAFT_1584466 [Boletus edulis]|nr:hypothetical protein EV363DRAFT_1584466 [Boletus edulis]